MTRTLDIPLGELIHAIYEEFLTETGDDAQASRATAASINELLNHATIRHEAPADEAVAA